MRCFAYCFVYSFEKEGKLNREFMVARGKHANHVGLNSRIELMCIICACSRLKVERNHVLGMINLNTCCELYFFVISIFSISPKLNLSQCARTCLQLYYSKNKLRFG